MAIGGRSTAIKLSNGGVWVLASTTLDEPTRKVIDELGPVHYLIGADSVHYMFLGMDVFALTKPCADETRIPAGEFQKAYPEAKLLTVEEVAKKAKELNIRVDGCAFCFSL